MVYVYVALSYFEMFQLFTQMKKSKNCVLQSEQKYLNVKLLKLLLFAQLGAKRLQNYL